jgi:hypothetical protein
MASEPWSWFLDAPAGLAQQLLRNTGAVWRVAFAATSFASFFGYAAGVAVFRARPQRILSVAIGLVLGFAVVAATRSPLLAGANFGPLVYAAVAAGLFAGLVVGFFERRANYSLKRTVADRLR